MRKEQTIYICGNWDKPSLEFNRAEKHLYAAFNGKVINPVREVAGHFIFSERVAWEERMLFCLRLLSGCTHIFVMNNYHQSVGACIEVEWARKLGIVIIHEDEKKAA